MLSPLSVVILFPSSQTGALGDSFVPGKLIPIFACILTDEETTLEEKSVLMSFYLPYFIFPLWLIMIASSEQSAALDIKKKKL